MYAKVIYLLFIKMHACVLCVCMCANVCVFVCVRVIACV